MPGDFIFTGQVSPVCQIGLGTTRTAEPSSWQDVSCYVHEAEIFRGRERFTERFEPGTASITFSNADGWADLTGDYAAVAAQALRPGRPIRVGVAGPFDGGPVTTRWLFRGWIDQATPAYDPVLHDIVSVNAIDSLGEAGQTVAGEGPLQGVNETVTARLNRVLDAVGWFPAKRKIAASPTLLQGTVLGSGAVDLMGTAADSAGGVVFGDLDGDVVFRDLNWMLYDPDLPHDGEIGNMDPGVPPTPHDPPYVDPILGTVYDPDAPPATHPSIIKICPAPGPNPPNGTIVERGDGWKVYVANGHLYYVAGGRTWDMGPYGLTDGCVAIVDPPPYAPGGGGGDPGDPGDPWIDPPPERWDEPPGPPGPDGEPPPWEIAPPPTEVPPGGAPLDPAVTLLAWSEGCPEDGPQTTITLGPVDPGPDALMVLLLAAQGVPGQTGPWTPTVTGGGGDGWIPTGIGIMNVAPPLIGVEAFYRVESRGADPGAFEVVIDFPGESAARLHACALYRFTHPGGDFLERVAAGDMASGVATTIPAANYTLTMTRGTWEPVTLQATDVTIALSLADRLDDSPGPFAALFGPTLNPPPYDAWDEQGTNAIVTPAEPAARAEAPPWSDDFERADGDPGPNWIIGPGPGYADEVHALSIQSGAMVASRLQVIGSGTYTACAMHWAEPQGADQVIEMELDPPQYCYLFTHASGTDYSQQFCDFQFGSPGEVAIAVYHFAADGNFTDSESAIATWTGSGPVRVRLESDADGTQRVYVDDVLALTWVDPAPVSGPFVGMGIDQNPDVPLARILRAAGSSLGSAGIVKCVSWSTGTRTGATNLPDVFWSDLDVSPDDLTAGAIALVLEGAAVPGFSWSVDSDPTGIASPTGALALNPGDPSPIDETIAPSDDALLVVFVGVVAPGDIAGSITCSSGPVSFNRIHVVHPSGGSRGQGAIFTGRVPPGSGGDAFGTLSIGLGGNPYYSVNDVVYEVRYAEPTAPVGGVAGAAVGTGTAGSVDGPFSMNLSAAPTTADVTLAMMSALAPGATFDGGASTADGDTWEEDVQRHPIFQGCYAQGMSRAPGITDIDVTWADMNTGTSPATDGVALAVVIKPDPAATEILTGPIILGGLTDPFSNPILSVTAETGTDPNNPGDLIWTFP